MSRSVAHSLCTAPASHTTHHTVEKRRTTKMNLKRHITSDEIKIDFEAPHSTNVKIKEAHK